VRIAVAIVAVTEAFQHFGAVRCVMAVAAGRHGAVLIGMAERTVQQGVCQVALLEFGGGFFMATATGTVVNGITVEQVTDMVDRMALHARFAAYKR